MTAGRNGIVTVGHSNGSCPDFLRLLRAADIEIIADVRSIPYSRHAPQFNEPDLRFSTREAGLGYVPMGDQLGGRPTGADLYDDEGHVLYARVAGQDFFRAGIGRLIGGAASHRIAIMCSEESPIDCHRRLLVGRVLIEHGVEVLHLRRDGRMQSEDEVRAEELIIHPDRNQVGMFTGEEAMWRSTRSVSPNARPRSSSARSNVRVSDAW